MFKFWKSLSHLWISEIIQKISILLQILLLARPTTSLQSVSTITAVNLASFATSVPHLTASASAVDSFSWNLELLSAAAITWPWQYLMTSPSPSFCWSLWATTSNWLWPVGGGYHCLCLLPSVLLVHTYSFACILWKVSITAWALAAEIKGFSFCPKKMNLFLACHAGRQIAATNSSSLEQETLVQPQFCRFGALVLAKFPFLICFLNLATSSCQPSTERFWSSLVVESPYGVPAMRITCWTCWEGSKLKVES